MEWRQMGDVIMLTSRWVPVQALLRPPKEAQIGTSTRVSGLLASRTQVGWSFPGSTLFDQFEMTWWVLKNRFRDGLDDGVGVHDPSTKSDPVVRGHPTWTISNGLAIKITPKTPEGILTGANCLKIGKSQNCLETRSLHCFQPFLFLRSKN